MLKTIRYLGITLVISGLLALIFALNYNYEEFIHLAIKLTNTPESKKLKITSLLTEIIFKTIQFIPILISFFGITIYYLSKSLTLYFHKTYNWTISIRKYLVDMQKKHKYAAIAIIGISLIFNTYNALTIPIFYDEAWTYLNFTRIGILSSASWYPAPNNHILHSILTNITYNFPFSQTVNLRLPSIITTLIASICFFYLSTKFLSKNTSLILLTLFCFSYPVIHYGYQARGYSLLMLSFIICFYSVLKICYSKNSISKFKKYTLLLSCGAIMGFYTMPSFLYPYFTCISFVFIHMILEKKYKNILSFTLVCFSTSIIIITLYTPIFLVSGIESVISNRFVEPISRIEVLKRMIPHFSETTQFLFSSHLFVISTLLVSIVLIIRKEIKVMLTIYCFLIVPFILLIHSVIPFPRSWIYLIVPFLFLIGLLIENFKTLRFGSTILICSGIVVLLIFHTQQKNMLSTPFSFKANRVAEFLINKNAKNVYINHGLLETNLRYIFEEKNQNIAVTYSNNKTDTNEIEKIKSSFDFVIIENKSISESDFNYIKSFDSDIHLSSLKKPTPNTK